MQLKNQYYLEEALKLAPTRRALRTAPMGDLWLVREEPADEYPFTLIHRFNPTGYPGDPYTQDKWQFRTLDELQAHEQILDTWLSNYDWFPDNDEARKTFPVFASEAFWTVTQSSH